MAPAPDDDDAPWRLSASDRLGPPPRRPLARWARRGTLALLLAAAGSWHLLAEEPLIPVWLQTEIAALASSALQALRQAATRPQQEAPATEPRDSAPLPLQAAAHSVPDAPPLAGEPAASAMSIGTEPVSGGSSTLAPTAPASQLASKGTAEPASAAAPRSPLQARAEAAGLHPDLSRALLERLSATDYRNAARAVRTALAETPEDGVLVWPRQRAAELALFEVRFVPGAAPDCRRYVVTILKDRWATTALPMERCGIAQRTARRP